MNGLNRDEAMILYTALVNYTTAELRTLLVAQGEEELAESLNPFALALLAISIKGEA